MADRIHITIDGKATEARLGETILSAAKRLGIDVPTLCAMEGKKANESCGVCMVAVEGREGLLPACATRALDGMVVHTNTEAVRKARRLALDLLLSDHLGDCLGPCQLGCPAHIDIPRFVELIREGEYRESLVAIKQSVAFPAVLGRICPGICENVCRRKDLDEAVSICSLKRFAADRDLASDRPYVPEKMSPTGKKVAIVGAGIAGLTAAYYLLAAGHECTVFDAHEAPGGAMRLIPELRLPREVVRAEIAVIETLGMRFRPNRTLGKDLTLEDLKKDHDVVLLTLGRKTETALNAPENERPVHPIQSTSDLDLLRHLGLETTDRGVKADRKTYATSMDGVFAAGGVAGGGRYAVHASAAARHAAEAICRWLKGEIHEEEKPFHVAMHHLSDKDREQYYRDVARVPRLPTEPISAEVDGGFSVDNASAEARRCLQCACVKKDDCKLRIYAAEYGADPHRYGGERQGFEREITHEEVVYEPAKCIKCGKCILIAAESKEPLGLAYIGRGFHVKVGVPFGETLKAGLRKVAIECVAACPTGTLGRRKKG